MGTLGASIGRITVLTTDSTTESKPSKEWIENLDLKEREVSRRCDHLWFPFYLRDGVVVEVYCMRCLERRKM